MDLPTNQLSEWTKKADADASLTSPQTIHYPTFDLVEGKPRTITAYVLRPPDRFTEPGPVWINIHGGPESQASPIMDPFYQLAQKRGITIIIPNVRGSAGYGKSYLKLDNGYLRENSVKDIGALLDWIESQPEFNKERIAVMGGSYGGYMVLASAVHYSDRLRCGADLYGIANFVTFLENTREYRRDLRRAEYGDERIPEMRQFLESISPLNNTEKINIPLLIYQGKNDPRVPLSESRQIRRRYIMRKLALVLLCFVLACANRNPTQDAKDMIKSHEEYAKTSDLDGVMTNVADDVVVLIPGTPLVEGKEAFKEFYAGLLAMGSIDDFGHDYHGIEIIGDTVVLHGVAKGTQTSKDGASTEFANNFILVLKYQPGGKIKFWRVAFAPSSQ